MALEVRLKRERLVGGVDAHAGLAVLPDALLKEVGLALQRDHLHPVERVRRVVLLLAAELHQQPVGAELDVLPHQSAVHADKLHGQRGRDELLFEAKEGAMWVCCVVLCSVKARNTGGTTRAKRKALRKKQRANGERRANQTKPPCRKRHRAPGDEAKEKLLKHKSTGGLID